jgi:hypothetical protein
VRFDPTHRAERRTPHFIDTPLKAGCGRRDRVRLITTRSMVMISTPQGSTGYASWRARQCNSTPIYLFVVFNSDFVPPSACESFLSDRF